MFDVSQQLYTDILKEVSRSFYLSMRILPSAVRAPISLAYLLARAADSVADLDLVENQQRHQFLESLLSALEQDQSSELELTNILKQAHDNNKAEAALLSRLPEVLQLYYGLNRFDKSQVCTVVTTLVSGMQFDLNYFHQSSNDLSALKTEDELNHYTYLVAGCVGDFWTKILCEHTPQLAGVDINHMSKQGVNLGKGLQLVNILRDLPQDIRNNRCYLPLDDLSRLNLTPEMLLEQNNLQQVFPLLNKLSQKAASYYNDGLDYVLSIPANQTRLRLSAIWPLVFGLETLILMWQSEQWLDASQRVKIARKQIYKTMFTSFFIVRSDKKLKKWIEAKQHSLQSCLK